ncbi:MAG: ATP-binding cassette domain-containing protein [Planctomycetota bacterium]
MIELRELRKTFGRIVAVDGVSFTVKTGEILGFLGPNGAGKSTTMKMLTGYLRPTSGTALVGGSDVRTQGQAVKRLIGYLPEGAPAYPDMTPLGFLRFVGTVRGLSGKALASRIDAVVSEVSLEGVLRQPIETLSKGYKRRVGLAQALLHDPDVLILDEPTDGLDPNQKHEVRRLIRGLSSEKIVVLSTHILEEVEAVCSRAIIIAHGRVVADGAPEALRSRSRTHNAVVARVRSAGEDLAATLRRVPDVASVEQLGGGELRVLPRDGKSIASGVGEALRTSGAAVDELRVEQGRLDEVFRDLTMAEGR